MSIMSHYCFRHFNAFEVAEISNYGLVTALSATFKIELL